MSTQIRNKQARGWFVLAYCIQDQNHLLPVLICRFYLLPIWDISGTFIFRLPNTYLPFQALSEEKLCFSENFQPQNRQTSANWWWTFNLLHALSNAFRCFQQWRRDQGAGGLAPYETVVRKFFIFIFFVVKRRKIIDELFSSFVQNFLSYWVMKSNSETVPYSFSSRKPLER